MHQAGRFTALAPALAPSCLLLCFASVIVWTENKNFTISDRWPLYLFYFDSETISAALAVFVFWGRQLKRSSTFWRKKVHPGDLAGECSDLEMTWLLCCTGTATVYIWLLTYCLLNLFRPTVLSSVVFCVSCIAAPDSAVFPTCCSVFTSGCFMLALSSKEILNCMLLIILLVHNFLWSVRRMVCVKWLLGIYRTIDVCSLQQCNNPNCRFFVTKSLIFLISINLIMHFNSKYVSK